MLGNVWEWCKDELGETDPLLEMAQKYYGRVSFRVLRGGAFYSAMENCRSANRNYNQPVNRNNNTGFRVVAW